MEFWQLLGAVLTAALASNGLWALVQRHMDKKDVRTQMLIGLAHDRIMYLGMQYIKKGFVTSDDYENLQKYLYEPYVSMGGNGAAKRIMAEVDKLPLIKPTEEKGESA